MGYLGKTPSPAPLTSGDIPDLATSKITSGTFADARISESSVTAHVTSTDLTPVRQDVLTLALKQATNENASKFNLPNSAITKFEADADFNSGGSTNTTRNASEYIWATTTSTTTGAFGLDSDTVAYMDWNSAVTTVTGEDASNWASGSTDGSGVVLNTSIKKFGASSVYIPATGYINHPISGGTFNSSYSGDWTIEFWYKSTAVSGYPSMINKSSHSSNVQDFRMYLQSSGSPNQIFYADADFASGQENLNAGVMATDTTDWNHYALTRDGADVRVYVNGVQKDVETGAVGNLDADYGEFRIGYGYIASGAGRASGYYDDMRLSKICRYPDGTTFTPNETTTIVANATGTALGTTNVPSSAVTDVSGVMLMKNAYGTNTLGTDVKVYFTADNSNWTEATSYADAGTFSTGIKMIKLGKTTCTSGSDVRWKAVWANQAASSKEAHIYGIGLNY